MCTQNKKAYLEKLKRSLEVRLKKKKSSFANSITKFRKKNINK